jgi:hypothetical protein
MFPTRNGARALTSVLLLTFAAFSASARDTRAEATQTATPTASPTATPTATPPTTLGNISTRALVGIGDNVVIAGFILTGSEPKKVIVRGIGPSLQIAGKLDDPTLELRDGNGVLMKSNDDWKMRPDGTSQEAEVRATGLAPTNDLESAIIAKELPPNATYTAILQGYRGGTGIGVVEVYDLNMTADSKLANISTRGFVGTGDDVMIGGTVVAGVNPQTVIIRAIGPSLSLPGKLRDPTLQLLDANGVVIDENDNWEDSPNKQAIVKRGLAPSDAMESAIAATLPAKNTNYTVIVRGILPRGEAGAPLVSRTQTGSGSTLEIQRVEFAQPPSGGTFKLALTRPTFIISGQPGDKAALQDSITIPWNATADDIKTAILLSKNFYKYDQNNNLTAGPNGFHTLFDIGGGLGISGNEGSRREPVISGSATDFTIQFGTLTTGAVGTHNPWVRALPLVQVDDSLIIYPDTGIAVVEIYALQ